MFLCPSCFAKFSPGTLGQEAASVTTWCKTNKYPNVFIKVLSWHKKFKKFQISFSRLQEKQGYYTGMKGSHWPPNQKRFFKSSSFLDVVDFWNKLPYVCDPDNEKNLHIIFLQVSTGLLPHHQPPLTTSLPYIGINDHTPIHALIHVSEFNMQMSDQLNEAGLSESMDESPRGETKMEIGVMPQEVPGTTTPSLWTFPLTTTNPPSHR